MKNTHYILFHSPPKFSFLAIERLIKAWGYEVAFARDAEELKKMIKEKEFEFVVIASSKEAEKILFPENINLSQLRLAEVEKRCILKVLELTKGNKSKAARILGVDTKTLYNKLKLYSIGIVGRRKKNKNQSTK